MSYYRRSKASVCPRGGNPESTHIYMPSLRDCLQVLIKASHSESAGAEGFLQKKKNKKSCREIPFKGTAHPFQVLVSWHHLFFRPTGHQLCLPSALHVPMESVTHRSRLASSVCQKNPALYASAPTHCPTKQVIIFLILLSASCQMHSQTKY